MSKAQTMVDIWVKSFKEWGIEKTGVISSGAFSNIFEAKVTGEVKAVKAMIPDNPTDSKRNLGLVSLVEIDILCSHSNCSNLIQSERMFLTETSPEVIFIMPKAIADIDRYIKSNKLAYKEIKALLYEVAKSIWTLHMMNRLHLDVKPANILIMSDGKVKLADFNLSSYVDKHSGYVDLDHLVITPNYRPPEHFKNEKRKTLIRASAKSDVWSYGILVGEILTGRLVFNAEKEDIETISIDNIVRRVKKRFTLTATGVNRLSRFLKKMLVFNPERRYNMKEVLEDDFFKELAKQNSPVAPIFIMPSFKCPTEESKTFTEITGLQELIETCYPSDHIRILFLAVELYHRTFDLAKNSVSLRQVTCAWMAHRMFYNQNVDLYSLKDHLHLKVPDKIVCAEETRIVNHLGGRLYINRVYSHLKTLLQCRWAIKNILPYIHIHNNFDIWLKKTNIPIHDILDEGINATRIKDMPDNKE